MIETLNLEHRSDAAVTSPQSFGKRPQAIFGCGHTADLPHPGHASDKAYLAWISSSAICRDCWTEKKSAPAVVHALEHGLPQLRGSKAQQKWALSIRHRILLEIWSGKYLISSTRQRAAADALAAIPSAGWWIGHRMHPAEDLLADLVPRQAPIVPKPTFRGTMSVDDYFNSLK